MVVSTPIPDVGESALNVRWRTRRGLPACDDGTQAGGSEAANVVWAAVSHSRSPGRECRMDCTSLRQPGRRVGWLMVLAAFVACGCQTVKTPEEKIAQSNIPRELNKVSMPDYVVEPPDLILVEVLEVLPGRPISGELLVRPDGKITLGFYGEVYVAGLTPLEIKEKVILHLRKFLSDDQLGLVMPDPDRPGRSKTVPAADSVRVYVDVSAYNSKNY